MSSVRKHWYIVLATIVLGVGSALFATKLATRIYQASALMEFDPNAIRPLTDKTDVMSGMSSYWDNRENYETQYKIIVADHVLTRVVRDLGLQRDLAFQGNKPAGSATEALVGEPPSVEDVAAILRGRIVVEPVKTSRLFYIQCQDADPARARTLCDRIARVYMAQNLEKTINATGDAVVWLNGQVDHYRSELEQNENALHDFKQKNELPSTSLNEASNMLRLELQAYNEALTRTRTKRQELLARNAELSGLSSEDPSDLPASELISNAFLGGLRSQYLGSHKERSELLAEGKGENHPLVRRATERQNEARTSLLGEIKNIQGAVARDLAVLTRTETGELSLYEASRRRAVDLNMKEIEYRRIDRAREQNEKLVGLLVEHMKQADLARMMNVNNVRLLDPPLTPRGPIRPRAFLNLAVGLALGVLFGVIFAVSRDQLDSSIKTPDDVETGLGATFLGLLPSIEESAPKRPGGRRRRRGGPPAEDAEGAPELIVHDRPLSGLAEAARSVRTNILFMNPDKPFRRLLVSSAAPSEGKTTVACSIAIALAQSGQRVCIVDCDLRRPRLHRVFDRVGDQGVTNVMLGQATIEEVARPTRIPNLWCVPAGLIPPNPADTLQSERFRRFLDELSERFDRLVIDSPPVVAVTDSVVMSTIVDGTVFVTRAYRTSKSLARQGLKTLRDVGACVVGVVLNSVDLNKHEYNSYYHYYYYKREGYNTHTPPVQVGPLASSAEEESSPTPPLN